MKLYRTKPREVEASDPLTTENRDEVVEWIRGRGTKVEVPFGANTFLLLLASPPETPVYEGERIVLEQGRWFVCDEEVFNLNYESA